MFDNLNELNFKVFDSNSIRFKVQLVRIFWCPFAQELWKLTDYPFLVGQKEEIPFSGVLLYATEFLEKESFAKLLVYAWGIWT